MNSITLLILELILSLLTMITIYKKYKITGLYTYIIIAFILSFTMSLKTINIYNFDTNLGIILFSSIFIAVNIIVQKNGPDEVKKLILTLVSISVASFSILYLVSRLDSSNINLFTNKSYDNIFLGSERIFFANIATILYTILINSKLYYYLKTTKNKIWISNLFSAIIINFIAAIFIPVLAYAFIKDPVDIIKLIIIRYLISLIASIFGTINIYIANNIKEK